MPPRPRPSCRDKALELLARRAHFRRELGAKLERRGYPAEEITAALERLSEAGWLDDARTAREWLAARLARGAEGRRRLAVELRRRGASAEIAAVALDEVLPADDLALARQAASAWGRRRGGDPRALARHLERKGFTGRAIVTLVTEAEAAASDEGGGGDH